MVAIGLATRVLPVGDWRWLINEGPVVFQTLLTGLLFGVFLHSQRTPTTHGRDVRLWCIGLSVYAMAIVLASASGGWPLGTGVLVGFSLGSVCLNAGIGRGGAVIAAVGVTVAAVSGVAVARTMGFELTSLGLLAIGPTASALLVCAIGRRLAAHLPAVPFGAGFCVGLAVLRTLTLGHLS
jgi:hypothetical protein